jgi:hypothetical protein
MSNGSDLKPKMQVAIEHLDQAGTHMNKAMTVLSSIILDLQKGADFITQYRDSLFKTLEDAGGNASIESQMKEFIPRRHRKDGQVEEVKARSED